MDRFCSGPFVDRLRRLALPLIDADERLRILRELDREMEAFREEMRARCAAAACEAIRRERLPEHA